MMLVGRGSTRKLSLNPCLVFSQWLLGCRSFGTVHVEKSMCFTLFISNPTLIEAVWKLVHVPSPPPKRQSIIPLWADKEAMKLRDDESVFSFSDRQGTLKGPVLPLKSSACSLPEDFNIM